MDKYHRIILVIAIALPLLFPVGFSNITHSSAISVNEDNRYGGTLIDSIYRDIQIINPILSSDTASGKIENFLYEGLITYDKDMNIVPCLARSWKISSDKLQYTFYLREDVYWHDGQHFTADDVIFTWDRLLDPDTETTKNSMFEKLDIENNPYEKIEDNTVVFYLQAVDVNMLDNLRFPIIPEHVYENHLGSDGIPHTEDDCRDETGYYTFNEDPRNWGFQEKNPIGTGCMMFQEWEVDDHVTLIQNSQENGGPGYWNEHDAYLDRYQLRIIGDVNVQLLALQHGTIHMMDLTSTPLEDIEDLEVNPNIRVYQAPTFTSNHFAFQCDPYKGDRYHQSDRDFEQNLNHFAEFAWQAEQYPHLNISGYLVRQALNYGLNKTKVIEQAYFSGIRNLGPTYRAQVQWYNEEVNPYTYNITKANLLLGQAGFGYSSDDPRRRELNFTLSYNQGIARGGLCYEARDQWAKLGITVTVEMLEWVSMLSTHYDNRNFDMMSAGWTGGGTDPDLSGVWHSSNIRPKSQPVSIDPIGRWIFSDVGRAGGLNYMSYWNPEVDELLETAPTETDQTIRKMYYDQIQELIVADSPYIWVDCRVNRHAINASFRGFVDNSVAGLWPAPVGFHNIYYQNITETRLSPKKGWNGALVDYLMESFFTSSRIFNITLLGVLSMEIVVLTKLVSKIRQGQSSNETSKSSNE